MTLWNRRRFLRGAGASVWLSAAQGPAVAAPGNAVGCKIVDAKSGLPVSARVRLTDAQGKSVVPIGHPQELAPEAQEGDVRFQSKRFAYVEGSFSIDPNSLPLRYQIVKGYEFVIAEGEISPANVSDKGIAIPLTRWSSLADRGWYSGDIHIHHISPQNLPGGNGRRRPRCSEYFDLGFHR
jgi:hypothetical protein